MSDDKRHAVRVGVFLPGHTQLLDAACVDLLCMMSTEYLGMIEGQVKAGLAERAPSVTIVWVGTVDAGQPLHLTSGMSVVCTHRLSDPGVQPGELDVVVVPGPDPRAEWSAEVTGWLRGHAERAETDILSICTGIFVCGAAGLLAGRKVSGPRGLQEVLRQKFPGVVVVGNELRWVQDGNLWSSGGVTNGNDLVAAWARNSRHFSNELVDTAVKLSDAGDRPQKY